MSHIKLIVDGEVRLDDNLDTWQDPRARPEFVHSLLNPTAKPALHLMVAGLVLSQLALAGKSATITILTNGLDKWCLEVETMT